MKNPNRLQKTRTPIFPSAHERFALIQYANWLDEDNIKIRSESLRRCLGPYGFDDEKALQRQIHMAKNRVNF